VKSWPWQLLLLRDHEHPALRSERAPPALHVAEGVRWDGAPLGVEGEIASLTAQVFALKDRLKRAAARREESLSAEQLLLAQGPAAARARAERAAGTVQRLFLQRLHAAAREAAATLAFRHDSVRRRLRAAIGRTCTFYFLVPQGCAGPVGVARHDEWRWVTGAEEMDELLLRIQKQDASGAVRGPPPPESGGSAPWPRAANRPPPRKRGVRTLAARRKSPATPKARETRLRRAARISR
jgi:hypothetical protein